MLKEPWLRICTCPDISLLSSIIKIFKISRSLCCLAYKKLFYDKLSVSLYHSGIRMKEAYTANSVVVKRHLN